MTKDFQTIDQHVAKARSDGARYWREENGALSGMGILPMFPAWYGRDAEMTAAFNEGYCAERERADR